MITAIRFAGRPVVAALLLAAGLGPACAATVDSLNLYGEWRWVESSGGLLPGRGTPEACRCERWILFESTGQYRFLEIDSVNGYLLCHGRFEIHDGKGLQSEHGWSPDLWIELGQWWESWGHDQLVRFFGPDAFEIYPRGARHGASDAPTHLFARAASGSVDSLWARRTWRPLTDRPVRYEPEQELPGEGEFVYFEEDPVPIRRVEPVYPQWVWDAHIEGEVVLHVLVSKEGLVKQVKVIRGVTGLNEPAVDAVRRWLFRPAVSNKQPVTVWIELRFEFPP